MSSLVNPKKFRSVKRAVSGHVVKGQPIGPHSAQLILTIRSGENQRLDRDHQSNSPGAGQRTGLMFSERI